MSNGKSKQQSSDVVPQGALDSATLRSLTKAQKKQILSLRELDSDFSEADALKFCQKFDWNVNEIQDAFLNFMEEKRREVVTDWTDVKKKKPAAVKPETSSQPTESSFSDSKPSRGARGGRGGAAARGGRGGRQNRGDKKKEESPAAEADSSSASWADSSSASLADSSSASEQSSSSSSFSSSTRGSRGGRGRGRGRGGRGGRNSAPRDYRNNNNSHTETQETVVQPTGPFTRSFASLFKSAPTPQPVQEVEIVQVEETVSYEPEESQEPVIEVQEEEYAQPQAEDPEEAILAHQRHLDELNRQEQETIERKEKEISSMIAQALANQAAEMHVALTLASQAAAAAAAAAPAPAPSSTESSNASLPVLKTKSTIDVNSFWAKKASSQPAAPAPAPQPVVEAAPAPAPQPVVQATPEPEVAQVSQSLFSNVSGPVVLPSSLKAKVSEFDSSLIKFGSFNQTSTSAPVQSEPVSAPKVAEPVVAAPSASSIFSQPSASGFGQSAPQQNKPKSPRFDVSKNEPKSNVSVGMPAISAPAPGLQLSGYAIPASNPFSMPTAQPTPQAPQQPFPDASRFYNNPYPYYGAGMDFNDQNRMYDLMFQQQFMIPPPPANARGGANNGVGGLSATGGMLGGKPNNSRGGRNDRQGVQGSMDPRQGAKSDLNGLPNSANPAAAQQYLAANPYMMFNPAYAAYYGQYPAQYPGYGRFPAPSFGYPLPPSAPTGSATGYDDHQEAPAPAPSNEYADWSNAQDKSQDVKSSNTVQSAGWPADNFYSANQFDWRTGGAQ